MAKIGIKVSRIRSRPKAVRLASRTASRIVWAFGQRSPFWNARARSTMPASSGDTCGARLPSGRAEVRLGVDLVRAPHRLLRRHERGRPQEDAGARRAARRPRGDVAHARDPEVE